MATLCKFVGQSLQTTALREEAADNSYQRIRFTRCPAFSLTAPRIESSNPIILLLFLLV